MIGIVSAQARCQFLHYSIGGIDVLKNVINKRFSSLWVFLKEQQISVNKFQ